MPGHTLFMTKMRRQQLLSMPTTEYLAPPYFKKTMDISHICSPTPYSINQPIINLYDRMMNIYRENKDWLKLPSSKKP